MLRAWVGMTGPVILGRAGRTPLPLCCPANHPVSGLPLSAVSHLCTFARGSVAVAHLHCVLRLSGQLSLRASACSTSPGPSPSPNQRPVPPCHHASMPPRGSAAHVNLPTCPLTSPPYLSAAMSSHPFRYCFVSSASASGLPGNFMLAASQSSFTPLWREATLPSCTASVSGPA